jgi:hypothetical protein
MKRFWLLVSLLAFGFTGTVHAQQAQFEDVTLTASVVDLSCKVVHNLSGADHRMCAQVCADQGIPLALLGEDGQIYLPVTVAMPGHGDNERLKPFAEQQVQVTGKVIDRGGIKSIVIEDVKEA